MPFLAGIHYYWQILQFIELYQLQSDDAYSFLAGIQYYPMFINSSLFIDILLRCYQQRMLGRAHGAHHNVLYLVCHCQCPYRNSQGAISWAKGNPHSSANNHWHYYYYCIPERFAVRLVISEYAYLIIVQFHVLFYMLVLWEACEIYLLFICYVCCLVVPNVCSYGHVNCG
jgi:hypothetical protein